MVVQLWLGARGMGAAAQFDDRFRARLWRIALASALMGGVLWATQALIGPWLYQSGTRYIALAVLIAVGIVAYFAIGQVLGAFRLQEFRRALRR